MSGRWFVPVALAAACLASFEARADNGTFLDRELVNDLRVATWNVYNDSIFPDTDPTRAAKFARLAPAVNADVWAFQEMYNHTATDVLNLMNSVAPLPGGASWQIYKPSGNEHVIASKYPLSLQRSNTYPAGYRPVAMALVDLPNAVYTRDLYLMNAHYKAFAGYDPERQKQSDAFVNWMRDARTSGGSITLATGTPMVVLGDFNLVEGIQPLTTLLNGDIQDEATYGPDSPPDWDGSSNTDAAPFHNTVGPDQYTWRNDGSSYPPSRLDYITYTDSVIDAPRKFVLNTLAMSASDRAAAGLQPYDSLLGNTGSNYDHLPVVVDFRMSGQQTLVWNPPDTTWQIGGTNWLRNSGSASFSNGDVARFTNVGVGSVTIAAGGVAPSAIMVVNTAGTYTFSGGPIAGTGRLYKSGAGTLVLAAANTYTGGTEVYEGTLRIAHPDAVAGGTVLITRSARAVAVQGMNKAVLVKGLSITTGAQLEMTDNDLVLDYTGASPAGTIRTMLIDGRITSSLADASKRLGYADNTALGLGIFSGQVVDPTSVLIKFTYYGDANLDGQVDITDLGKLATRWQTAGTWLDGDFDYSGFIDITDLGKLATNWQAGVGNPLGPTFEQALALLGLPSSAVPEPVVPAVVLLAVLATASRRGRIGVFS